MPLIPPENDTPTEEPRNDEITRKLTEIFFELQTNLFSNKTLTILRYYEYITLSQRFNENSKEDKAQLEKAMALLTIRFGSKDRLGVKEFIDYYETINNDTNSN